MAKAVGFLAVFLALASALGAASAAPEAKVAATPAAEIERIVRERLAAAARGDKDAWRRHIAADCVWTGPGLAVGSTADAAVEISANRTLAPRAAELRDFEVRVFGPDAAVATYVSIQPPAEPGGAAKRYRKTDTYLRREGNWQLIAANEVFVPTRAAVATPPERLDAYGGRYRLDDAHVVRVWREGGRLLSQQDGEAAPTEFHPSGEDTFFTDGEPGEWVFGRKEGGAVDRLVFRMEGGTDVVLLKVD